MSLGLIANAISVLMDSNLNAQTAAAFQGITEAPALLSLQQAWMATVNADALKYANDSRASIADPSKGVVAAQDNEQMSIDQGQSDLDTGNFQNILETLKSIVQYLGNNLKNALKLEDPINNLNELTLSQIMRIKR